MPRTHKQLQWLMRIVVTLGLYPAGIPGQAPTGEITGTVPGPTRSRAPHRHGDLVNTSTGATRELLTNENGIYNFPALLPGAYNVTAGRDGFRDPYSTVHSAAGSANCAGRLHTSSR